MFETINAISESWWAWMWPMLWQVALLVAIIWAIDFALRKRVWPQLRYALWLLVIVKLVLPPTFSLSTSLTSQLHPLIQRTAGFLTSGNGPTPLSDRSPLSPAPEQATSIAMSTTDSSAEPTLPLNAGPSLATEPAEHAGTFTTRGAKATADAQTIRPSARTCAMCAWLLGIVLLAAWLILRVRSLRRRYAASKRIVVPPWLSDSLSQNAQRLGLRRLPRIVVSSDITSPAVFGPLRPVLLLPGWNLGEISKKDVNHILLHELAHVKRGDLWVHTACMMLQLLYWFNPLLWLACRRLQHLRELCCDATVARILQEDTPEYRRTILDTARRLLATAIEPGMGLLGLFEDSNRLLVRLQWLEKKTWRFTKLRAAAIFTLVAFMSICILPMAQAQKSDQGRDFPTTEQAAENWPSFRGPGGAGISTHADIPSSWDGPTGKNIAWKSPVPLSGHNSPIIWQDRVFISGASQDKLEVYCYDAFSGKPLWTGSVPMTRPARGQKFEVMDDTGLAAPTMATDGRRVCAIFATGDISCFTLDGHRLWTRGLGIPDSVYGYASSLAVHKNLFIVQLDQGAPKDGKSELLAFDAFSGDTVWRTKRPVPNSWSSPIVARINDKDTIFTCADPWVIAYDADAGTELWRANCLKGDIAPSPCYADGRVYVNEPYGQLVAIDADGLGDITASHIAWIADEPGPDICTPLTNGQWVFFLDSSGLLTCCDTKDGSKLWEQEIDAQFMASPSLVGDKLYLLSEKGTMFIAKADPQFELIGKSEIGERCYASPGFAPGRIYIRSQKNLYCISDTVYTSGPPKPQGDTPPTPSIPTAGIPIRLSGLGGRPSDLPGSWPGFRGPNIDAVYNDQTTLDRTWPADGPPVLWSVELGEGHAGAAVHNGCVYIMDYDSNAQADVIRCLSLSDGRDIWQYRYPVSVRHNHGISRTVPAVTDKYVVAIGPKCHVTCLDSATGQFKWMLDLVKDFNATVPPWYNGQCPLIDNGRAIIAVGGDALLIAVDCETGDIIWRSPNTGRWKMTHSSVIPLEFAGIRQYVYCAGGGVVAVNAEDGQALWDYDYWKVRTANVPTPVVAGPGRLFLSGGYDAGSMMLQLEQQAGAIIAEPAFKLSAQVYGSSPHTPILYKGHIYGVRADGQLTCLDLEGNLKWQSGSERKFGIGPYVIANGLLYAMDDAGTLTLAEATPTAYTELARAKVLDGPDAWGPMAVVPGRLIIRDLNRMVCLATSTSPIGPSGL